MKTIATRKKRYWKYLFWLGPALVVIGLSAGVVSGSWKPVPLGLLISGIVLTGLWLLFLAYESNWWGRRSTQAGTNALLATLAVLVILGLINFLAVRYPARVDFTETQLFTLAPQSRQVVRNLQQPVKVWVFDRNQNAQDRELLENYRRQNSQFSFEYVDPQARPGLAEKFGVKEFGEVHLEAGERRRLLQVANEQERLSEVRLTNGLQQIRSERTAKVYFLQGHGESTLSAGQSGLSQAVSVLGEKNYTTEPLNLTQQPIPRDATVVVVAGPKRALFDREVKALSRYLDQGGSLLLMIDPNTNPELDSLLKKWGVSLDNRLAIDPSGAGVGLGPAVPLVTNYGSHPITKDFGNGISFYRGARPIETNPVAGVQVTPLLLTGPQSWAESDLESQDLQFNPESDRQGPLTLGVALSRKVEASSESKQSDQSSPSPKVSPKPSPTNSPAKAAPDKKPAESRLVVIGNSTFATDGLFGQQLNGDVFLNSVSWLSKQDEQALSIRPKEAKNRRINLKPPQANILGLTALGIVPLIGFGTAVILWWQRR
jgi:ABC-type uncharacterized transport system involved in gliding motility auxiliary subunit